MKNLNISKDLQNKIIGGGLSFAILVTGYAMGKANFNNTEISDVKSKEEITREYLDEYIKQRSSLEKEIDELIEQKEKLQNNETFNLDELIVVTPTEDNKLDNLYILKYDGTSGIGKEYHNEFKAWYNVHKYTIEHVYYWCPEYVHLYKSNEIKLLYNYLTDEEIEKINLRGGEITTLELDEIENRLRSDYQKNISESNQLTK